MLQSLSPANASERDSDGGFSLVEIMVALAIFLVASGAVLGLIMVSLSTIRSNADRVYAASLARAELDAIRLLPADQIPIGTQEAREVSTDAGDFTISVTTGWSALPDDAVTPCRAGEGYILGGKAYVNARVSVAGGELGGPQVVDAVIYPNDAGSNAADNEDAKTGTMTISVADIEGNAVAGASVTGRLLGTPLDDGTEQVAQTFTGTTDGEGCVFAPELTTSADWKVTVTPPGNYATESTEGLVQDKVVDALLNTPVNFLVAKPSTVTFAASDTTSITSQVIEFSRADQDSASDSIFVAPGATQTGLWPGTYTAWLRPCEGSVDGTVASAVVGQGESATVTIDVPKVQVYAAPGSSVTATYTSAACDTAITPIDFPAPGSDTFSTDLVETISVEKEVTDGAGNTVTDGAGNPVTETTTTVAKYVVPREAQFLTSGTWTFSDGNNSSKVRIDDTLPVCAVVLGDFPEDEGSETSFTPVLTTEEAEAFRTEIGVTADTELTAPILLPSTGVPELCPASS
ncbi:MAG: prepilin-type N-terminal cleavage/methylation domain-containing protein [Actinomycetia bacterium]|nr:prepilin-type N-terminal cleavage/methylation domain-containing protein [Actinomycetes bacterium]